MTMGITSPTSTTGQILKNGSAVISFDANNNATFAGNVAPTVNPTFRNRIINGAMVIDQRNAGASVTPTNGTYTLDRWAAQLSQASKFTVQQSSTAPVGFINSLKVTSSSAYTVGSSEVFLINQYIEGLNVADLAWGTANAKTVTLSFQVYSSLTGTFGGSIADSSQAYSYPFTYTISSANTWTQISVTITGPTAGTWNTNNGIGIRIWFGLGVGSTYSGTAGAWTATGYYSATGATSVVGTNGATWYITGVQLEVGSVATPFEQRLYGTELQLCQRYYVAYSSGQIINGFQNGTTIVSANLSTPVSLRATPTITLSAGPSYCCRQTTNAQSNSTTFSNIALQGGSNVYFTLAGFTGLNDLYVCQLYTASGSIAVSAEL
jgi:hypothetical protein